MIEASRYPKRLIEVDLPIRRISEHARREKYLGTITSLHLWWARRPLASCRAIMCAVLWPDPADDLCPETFRAQTRRVMEDWAIEHLGRCGVESYRRFREIAESPQRLGDNHALRTALLDFIADFSNPANAACPQFLSTSRALTTAAHEALGGTVGTRGLVVDPFAGGGSIPLEALRIGADAFGSDVNPVAVLLNKVVLEYVPRYGQRLVDAVRKWGNCIQQEVETELKEFYPNDPNGATPIAYLWARTIQCEGPGCGADVPLIRSLSLSKKANREVALQLEPRLREKRVDLKLIVKQRDGWVTQGDAMDRIVDPDFHGTVKRGAATCPCCGYTTPVPRIREQLKNRRGGSHDARLLCVITVSDRETGRSFRLANTRDVEVVGRASAQLDRMRKRDANGVAPVPDEEICLNEIRRISVPLYGMTTWGDLFNARQALALTRLVDGVRRLPSLIDLTDNDFVTAVQTCLALAVSRQADHLNTCCSWNPSGEKMQHLFARQAVPMVWDFCETNLFGRSVGNWSSTLDCCLTGLSAASCSANSGQAERANAQENPLPDDSAHGFVTDPPYYDAVPYSHLSDFFYVWLRRCLGSTHTSLFRESVVSKESEIVVDRPHELSSSTHDIAFYEQELTKAFAEGRRVLRPDGIGTVVFASKTTASWEAILKAIVDAGWIITGSWPIDTELETRIAAAGQARLASSVHIVCRPREKSDGSLRDDDVGDWRDVLVELPQRIHDWIPRLANEGVVGADAIFACLGPALEVFSRYSRVERASGEVVALNEYLEHVWAAVSREALSMIFDDPETSGLDEDARLTAMWLWTIAAPKGAVASGALDEVDTEGDDNEDDEQSTKVPSLVGLTLEYDAVAKSHRVSALASRSSNMSSR